MPNRVVQAHSCHQSEILNSSRSFLEPIIEKCTNRSEFFHTRCNLFFEVMKLRRLGCCVFCCLFVVGERHVRTPSLTAGKDDLVLIEDLNWFHPARQLHPESRQIALSPANSPSQPKTPTSGLTSKTEAPKNDVSYIHRFRFLDWRSSNEHETAYNICISILLVLFAGFASGMTVGLLSIDGIQLKILQEEGTQEEKRQAQRLESVLANHHLLLVTLLLANSIAMEALPIFLNKTVPEWVAVALSVTAILAFGEVLPQALCTGRWQIPIVMKALPIVDGLIYLLYGLSWPIAKALDVILGHNAQTYYARSHLKALIRLHQKEKRSGFEAHHGQDDVSTSELSSALGADEVVVIEGALDLATKMLEDIMVPIDEVYMLEWETVVTPHIRKELLDIGHSRVPIYKTYRHNVKGLLLVKSLICLDTNETPKVGDLLKLNRSPLFCPPTLQLYDLLNEFQRGRHMAFVTPSPEMYKNSWGRPDSQLPASLPPHEQLLGIATLEDVIEELIQEEIYDEFDHYQSTMFPRTARSNSVDTQEVNSALKGKEAGYIAARAHTSEALSHTQSKVHSSANYLHRDTVQEISPEVICLASKNKRVKDAVKPTINGSTPYKHPNLVGSKLHDLNKRLIDEDPLLFPPNTAVDVTVLGLTLNEKAQGASHPQPPSKRFMKSRTFLVKRANDKGDDSIIPMTNPSPKIAATRSIFRRYHSSDFVNSADIVVEANSRSVRNLVGIAAARQLTNQTKPQPKLYTIHSASGVGQSSYSPAKTELEQSEDDQYTPIFRQEGESRSDIVFTGGDV
eukprot:Gregarina_sp_Poly_1__11371@NODE_961_length_5544_cov_76_439109_g681_i0_p1_GENE_NODE_961_length_5544_cov_76_439109_g681_i0NODE_961_length_5544_cov_76_439109_g681_i0_p1_ORF_typecomplete_len796_score84_16DUF21/PF01595_20/4_1e38CBS/PF00571_28/1_1e04CBS/PF00571_28/0_012CBS/PF00571_28/1_8e04DUF4337/PF14235_6/1_2DUF4337/PF14235_6/7_8e02_NODE_961_length_5544_cov_76_439109_g681_i03362723